MIRGSMLFLICIVSYFDILSKYYLKISCCIIIIVYTPFMKVIYVPSNAILRIYVSYIKW